MEKILRKTKGYCHKCLKVVPADTVLINNFVHIRKKCKEHGVYTARHVWDDNEVYENFIKMNASSKTPSRAIIDLTNRCNMDCPVCYAAANSLDLKDFDRKNLEKYCGYKVIYLSGGEPTLRDDLFDIISELKRRNQKVILLTNGLKLLDNSYVKELKKSGMDMVFLQFDSLDDKANIAIRGKKLADKKIKILENLEKHKIPVYIVACMVKDNDAREVKKLINFVLSKDTVSGIGLNNIMQIGRYKQRDVVPTSEIGKLVCKEFDINKKNFTESTEFLMNLDRLCSNFTKARYVSKCVLPGLFLYSKGRLIPLGKIFDIEKINHYLKGVINKKSRMLSFLPFLVVNQLFFNFIVNRNFRLFLLKLIKNFRYFPDMFLLNPLSFITINGFPTYKNIDLEFADGCNFLSIPSGESKIMPSCLSRCRTLIRSGNKVKDYQPQ